MYFNCLYCNFINPLLWLVFADLVTILGVKKSHYTLTVDCEIIKPYILFSYNYILIQRKWRLYDATIKTLHLFMVNYVKYANMEGLHWGGGDCHTLHFLQFHTSSLWLAGFFLHILKHIDYT